MIQLMIRSRSKPTTNEYSLLNIPGLGGGKNKYLLEDELVTPYIQQFERAGLIATKYIKTLSEGVS
jgi:hypothetical protein